MGWAITRAEHERDMELIEEIGANTVRVLAPFKPQFGWTTRETGEIRPEYLDQLRQLLQIAGGRVSVAGS